MTNKRPRPFHYLCFPMGTALLAFTIGCGGGPHDDLSRDLAPHEAHGEARGDWEVEVSDGAESDHDHEGHGHRHEAPHGGTLIALGDHFAHLEMIHDATQGKITVFVLDGEAEAPVRVEQASLVLEIDRGERSSAASETVSWTAVTLNAVANPLTGETVGDTSEFSGKAEFLVGPMAEFTGRIQSVSILGSELENIEVHYPEGNEE